MSFPYSSDNNNKTISLYSFIRRSKPMKINHILVICLTVLMAGNMRAAEENGKDKAMDMDQMMQEAMKRGAPGEHHKALEPFAGQFTTTSRIWMNPGAAPHESTGSADHTWVFGGRFLKMSTQGNMGGMTFEGLGYLGYDNIRAEYTAVWIDNMNTGIAHATGSFDPATKTYSENGIFSCPMTGEKDTRFRGDWKVIDNNTLIYTMYSPGPDGTEVKGMEITYKRAK